MAVIGIGIDVVPADRVKEMLDRHGSRMLERLFTPSELRYAEDLAHKTLFLAGRLAAKEAAYKALCARGADLGIRWQHLEVIRLPDGRPELHLYGPALRRFEALGASSALLSLSHDGGIAAAVVILQS
ncbi:MAG TPA: holo-ACP synthase [Gemmatimonadales bacterium]|nr:holo-ACP synthase [Gemmatimonadales bacterium]